MIRIKFDLNKKLQLSQVNNFFYSHCYKILVSSYENLVYLLIFTIYKYNFIYNSKSSIRESD